MRAACGWYSATRQWLKNLHLPLKLNLGQQFHRATTLTSQTRSTPTYLSPAYLLTYSLSIPHLPITTINLPIIPFTYLPTCLHTYLPLPSHLLTWQAIKIIFQVNPSVLSALDGSGVAPPRHAQSLVALVGQICAHPVRGFCAYPCHISRGFRGFPRTLCGKD